MSKFQISHDFCLPWALLAGSHHQPLVAQCPARGRSWPWWAPGSKLSLPRQSRGGPSRGGRRHRPHATSSLHQIPFDLQLRCARLVVML